MPRIERAARLLYLKGMRGLSRPSNRPARPRGREPRADRLAPRSGPPAWTWLLASLCLGVAACAGPGRASLGPRTPLTSAPGWAHESLTWEKLSSIIEWLASPEAGRVGYWRVEAQLQLSEGRVTFTRRDLLEGGIEIPLLQQRLAQAQNGFEQVLTDPERDVAQANRAYEGLDASRDLARSMTAAPAPPALVAPERWVPRSNWGATAPMESRLTAHSGAWSRITVHHSAMENPLPMRGSLADSVAVVRQIQHAHTAARGWGDVGYHYLIDPYGRVFEGRPRSWQGAHAGGVNNVGNIGICMLGNFEVDRPSAAALGALETLIEQLRTRHGISRSDVVAHRTFVSTECPGHFLVAWLKSHY